MEQTTLTEPTLDVSKTAFVVIDLQHDIVELTTASHAAVVERSASLLAAARRDAYERNYRQFLVEDAMTGLDELSHQNAIERTFPRIGHVRRTEAMLAMMARPTQP